jgi:hypothetical protein
VRWLGAKVQNEWVLYVVTPPSGVSRKVFLLPAGPRKELRRFGNKSMRSTRGFFFGLFHALATLCVSVVQMIVLGGCVSKQNTGTLPMSEFLGLQTQFVISIDDLIIRSFLAVARYRN